MCDIKGKCGGCFYVDKNYDEQVKIKEDKVISLINSVVSYNYSYDGIVRSPLINEYRNKMEFTFGDSEIDGPLTLGMHQKKSFFNVLNANNCDLIDDNMRKIVALTRDFFDKNNVTYFHKKSHNGYLRNLQMRKSFYSNQYMINLVTTTRLSYKNANDDIKDLDKELLNKYVEYILSNVEIDANNINILHTKNDSIADAVINEGIELLYGKDYIVEELLGKKFIISPFSFFQTNTMACEKLYEIVKNYVPDDIEYLYDMFCGTGTIGILLSDRAKKVLGVEIVKEAIENAKINADNNNVKNIEFIAEDVNIMVKNNTHEKPDVMILDPPRAGVSDKSLESIIEYESKVFIYVSCKIESFIENYKIFSSHGYKIKNVSIVDMFPHTDNVESVIKLIKE